MKKIIVFVLASIFGSALTIVTFKLIDSNENNSLNIHHLPNVPVVGASYTVNSDGEVVPLDFVEIAKDVMPAVVHIKSTKVEKINNVYRNQQDPFGNYFNDEFLRHFFGPQYQYKQPNSKRSEPQVNIGTGSGVIINSNGIIVTNNHVIAGADDIEVSLEDNRIYKAKVIGTDPSTDLALLQIKETDLAYIPLVNSDKVEVGEWVLAVGNPFNLNSTVTAGIVSAKGRNINILQDKRAIESFIQTDAAINPGNSGGALVNLQGGLIGINTAIASPTGSYTGYGFAVPSNIVSKVVEDLMKYGMVQRGYLGLMIQSIDGNLAKDKNLDLTEGVYVDSITANSAAGDAGVKAGDVITKVDGVVVKSSAKLLELIGGHRPGDNVLLIVNRNGKELEKNVTLRNQEGETHLSEKESIEILNVLGVELKEIDKSTAKKLKVSGGLEITKLLPGKLKKSTDVNVGFIITSVDGKQVSKIRDFENLLKDKKGGVLLEGVYADYPGEYYYAFGL